VDNREGDENIAICHERGSFSYGVNVGYQVCLCSDFWVGGEVGFDNDGFSRITMPFGNRYKIYSSNFNLLATAKFAFQEFDIFGKFGAAWVRQKYRIDQLVNPSGVCDPVSIRDDWRPILEVGVGYTFCNGFNLHLAYKRIFADDLKNWARGMRTVQTKSSDPLRQFEGGNSLVKLASVNAVYLGLSYCF